MDVRAGSATAEPDIRTRPQLEAAFGPDGCRLGQLGPAQAGVFLNEFGDVLYDDAYVVSAGQHASWAWAWEHGSWLCVEDDDLVRRVSAGATAVVLHANEKPMVEFRYAEDGRLVTGINTLLSLRPEDRTGSEPHRFDATLCALEADPDSNDYGPLGLRGLFYRVAEDLGVGLPHEDLIKKPVFSGQLQPRIP